MLSFDEGPGIVNVRKDARRTAEDLVFKGYSFIDTDIVLYLATIPYCYVPFHADILTDDTVFYLLLPLIGHG